MARRRQAADAHARVGDAPGGGGDRLREPEVRVREERERELVVLADGDERPRRVQALRGEQVRHAATRSASARPR